MAGPHGRAQDPGVDRPARRGVGGGPAHAGHRPPRIGHRVPRAARPGGGRLDQPHGADEHGARRGAPAGRGRRGWSSTAGRRTSSAGARSRCASTRSAPSGSASCSRASSGCGRCWPPRGCSTRPASGVRRACPAAWGSSLAGERRRARRAHRRDGALARRALPHRQHPDPGPAGRAGDPRRADRPGPRPRRRRDRAGPRRRQRRGPAAVLRRGPVPGGRGVPDAGGHRRSATSPTPRWSTTSPTSARPPRPTPRSGSSPTSPRRPRTSRSCAAGCTGPCTRGWNARTRRSPRCAAAPCSPTPSGRSPRGRTPSWRCAGGPARWSTPGSRPGRPTCATSRRP